MLYSVDFIGFTRDKLRANHGSMSSNRASKVLILEHRIDLSVAPANTSNVQQSQDSPTYIEVHLRTMNPIKSELHRVIGPARIKCSEKNLVFARRYERN